MKSLTVIIDRSNDTAATLKHVAWKTEPGSRVISALCACTDEYHISEGHKPLYEIVPDE